MWRGVGQGLYHHAISFEFAKISQSIDFARKLVNNQTDKIFVGGIAASLMHDRFVSEDRWHGVRFIKGLLGEAPAVSLQLDDFFGGTYSDDRNGTPIEDLIPDYGILDQISYKYPVSDAYFAYASRGCIRKCSFCGVPKLEGAQRDVQSVTSVVKGIASLYGEKKDLVLMDNNIVASERFKEIIAEIRDLGFVPGVKLKRGRTPVQRRVDFNQGVDARILCKDPIFPKELSSICIKPLRIAFDHLGVRKQYEAAVRTACGYGLTELSNYMLYNFHEDRDSIVAGTLFSAMAINDILKQLDDGIRRLQEARRILAGTATGSVQNSTSRGRRGPRHMSKEARDRIAAAQRARWARQKAQSASASAPSSTNNSNAPAAKRGPRRLSRAARAKIAAAQKARWARVRVQKKK